MIFFHTKVVRKRTVIVRIGTIVDDLKYLGVLQCRLLTSPRNKGAGLCASIFLPLTLEIKMGLLLAKKDLRYNP